MTNNHDLSPHHKATVPDSTLRVADLRRRELLTAEMVHKLSKRRTRLNAALRERITALNKIRSELVALKAQPFDLESYEHSTNPI
jgi:hypothetical protein